MTDTCPSGHPYAGDNVRISNIGRRMCVTCRRDSQRRSAAKKRERLKAEASEPSAVEPETEAQRAYIVGEIEFLLDTERADLIARRLGYDDLQSLQRSLHRWGRHDLAAHFRREHWDPMYKRNQKVWC